MNIKNLPHHVSQQIKNKTFDVYWSNAAEAELQKRQQPLIVEMELKFACMVRMLVNFYDDVSDAEPISITDKLQVFYRPIIGQSCDISEAKSGFVMGELKTGPMADRFPKNLRIDFVKGEWVGKYS